MRLDAIRRLAAPERTRSDNVRLGIGLAFVAGASTTATVVNAGRRRGLSSAFALPLLIEASLLLVFGAFGARMAASHALFVPVTVVLLCYTMGLQNAVITKISRSEIRTTHVTGLMTDLGIELGKLFYMNRWSGTEDEPVLADRVRLRVLSYLLLAFFAGGLLGALGFQRFGYIATMPLAAILGVLAIVPALDDLRAALRR